MIQIVINYLLLIILPLAAGAVGAALLKKRSPRALRAAGAAVLALAILAPWILAFAGSGGSGPEPEAYTLPAVPSLCAALGAAAFRLFAFFRRALRGRRARRALLLTLAGALLAYLVTAGFLLEAVSETELPALYENGRLVSETVFENLRTAKTAAQCEAAARRPVSQSPHTAALTLLADKETREILAETGSVLSVSDRARGLYLELDLSPYLGERERELIRRYQKETGVSGRMFPSYLSLARNGDSYVPVELRFRTVYGSRPDQTLTLRLTDNAPALTYEEGDGAAIFAAFSSFTESARTRRLRESLRQATLAQFAQTHSGGGESGGRFLTTLKTGGLSCRIYAYYFRDPGGRACAAYSAFAFSPAEYVFHTQTYRGLFSALSAAFAVLTVLLACAVLRLLRKEERLEQARGAFLTAAAHELKTPLAVIANSCECIAENVSPEKNAEYAAAAFAETRRTAEMLGQLLRLTALETAEAPARGTAELPALVRAAAEEYREEAAQKTLALTLRAPDSLPLRCEETWAMAAFRNLISNAVRHTAAGGGITVELRREGRRAVLTVENAPAHIEEAELPHIWEPLRRGEKTRRDETGAAGLGLSVCKRIFELHGWKYKAENTANGVLFTVIMK